MVMLLFPDHVDEFAGEPRESRRSLNGVSHEPNSSAKIETHALVVIQNGSAVRALNLKTARKRDVGWKYESEIVAILPIGRVRIIADSHEEMKFCVVRLSLFYIELYK